ncbi:hypothetical protein C1T31_02405 [Hanstruepera neustonica]|uniref:Uncharacterized protein n=1 Tax=Hanstruepera neustonica TaxID=1445657 RepID=A0A2K1E3Z8_9FLAO|nr:GldM family protein [Hanstruepera neustonica]PNQ75008.1 hypothetical protein C1T31_02405 [Hanstruepera neustonica]
MKYGLLFLIVFFSLGCFSQEPPKAVVEVNNMNVVYRGVSNPLTLSMPGTVSFEASAPGLKKVDNYGNYIMHPGSGLTVDIELRGKLPNGEIVTAIKTLRIKNIGTPIGTLDGIGHGSRFIIELTKEQLRDGKIGIKIEDFTYDLNFVVLGFKMKFPDLDMVKVNGSYMSDEAKELIDNLKIDDVGFVFDIVYKIANNSFSMKGASAIQIKIIE